MEKFHPLRRAPYGSNPAVGVTGQATQQRILAAAGEAFADAGYAQTSVEAITDRAGCSRPTFYQYFSGKEDVHRRLAGRLGGEMSGLMARLGAITPDLVGRNVLANWLEELTDIHARHRAVADNFSASIRTDEQMVAGAADLGAEYRRAFVRALDPETVSTVPLEVLAEAATITAYGACLHRERIGDVDAPRLAAALADTLHRTFFGPILGVNIAPRVSSTPTRINRPRARRSSIDVPSHRPRGVETRQRLLDAARTAYGMLGFDAVRVDDIAAEAGMSHGTFYRYFPDKAAVFDEHADVASHETAELLAQLPAATGGSDWAASYYQHYEHHGAIIGCLPEARAAGSEGALRARHDIVRSLAAALDRRSFGDVDADIVTCLSLLENVPAAAYGYSDLSVRAATEATSIILAQGLFGRAQRAARADHRVVMAVIHRKERVLLCHRSEDREWFPDVWDLPGGHIEPGESPPRALGRELNEELGIIVDPAQSAPLGLAYDDVDAHVWDVSEWSGTIRNCALGEHDAIGWFSLAEIDELTVGHPTVGRLCRLALSAD